MFVSFDCFVNTCAVPIPFRITCPLDFLGALDNIRSIGRSSIAKRELVLITFGRPKTLDIEDEGGGIVVEGHPPHPKKTHYMKPR